MATPTIVDNTTILHEFDTLSGVSTNSTGGGLSTSADFYREPSGTVFFTPQTTQVSYVSMGASIMASNWGSSWGSSWGNSWGVIGAVAGGIMPQILFPVLSNILVPFDEEGCYTWLV